MSLLYLAGQFVWCRFPSREQPDQPGPKSRVGYVYAVTPSGQGTAAMLYTTTVPWSDPNLPLGVIPVDGRHAAALGQTPFTIDARTAAVLPVTAEYFPHLAGADHGIRGRAPIRLVRRIEEVVKDLRRRGIVIEVRGPKRTWRYSRLRRLPRNRSGWMGRGARRSAPGVCRAMPVSCRGAPRASGHPLMVA